MTDKHTLQALGGLAAIAVLAGPRKTRPLAGFLYGVVLSRAHGFAVERLDREFGRLFDERQSAHRRLDTQGKTLELLEDRLIAVENGRHEEAAARNRIRDRLTTLEACFGGNPEAWLARAASAAAEKPKTVVEGEVKMGADFDEKPDPTLPTPAELERHCTCQPHWNDHQRRDSSCPVHGVPF